MVRFWKSIVLLMCLIMLEVSFAYAQGGLEDSLFYDKSWAVIIGINHYQDSSLNLSYAVNDAKAVEARFRQMGFEIISLLDEKATRENILQLLTWDLPQNIGANDRLVVFYAGHGATGELPNGDEVGFLVPYDARKNFDIIGTTIRVSDLISFVQQTNFISVDDIRDITDTAPAKHVLYILDACNSGFFDPAVYRFRSSRRQGGSEQRLGASESGRGLVVGNGNAIPSVSAGSASSLTEEQRLTSHSTVQVLTAGLSGEMVSEKAGHGIFTSQLLRALDGKADLNGNCVIRASELATYLKEIVPLAALKATGSSQTPLFNRVSGEGEMIFIPPICTPLKPEDMKPPVVDEAWTKTAAYTGKKAGGYKQPSQIAVGPANNLYVLDSKRNKILKFDAQGNYVSDAVFHSGLDDSWKPYSMAIKSNGDLWVFYAPPENEAGKIIVYNPDGTPGESWAGPGAIDSCSFGDYLFPAKALIELDRDDNLFLLDQQYEKMVKCDRDGEFIAQWGDTREFARFTDPQGLAVDSFGYVYVANTGGHGIQKFLDEEWIKTRWLQLKGKKELYFNSPHGLAVDNRLFVYVADTENHRIKKYTSGGEKLLAYWGKKKAKKGKKPGEFNKPLDVAVSWDGRQVYVADTGNKRIQRFLLQ